MRPVVERRFIGQLTVGDFGDHAPVMADAQPAVAGDLADLDGLQSPLAEHLVGTTVSASGLSPWFAPIPRQAMRVGPCGWWPRKRSNANWSPGQDARQFGSCC